MLEISNISAEISNISIEIPNISVKVPSISVFSIIITFNPSEVGLGLADVVMVWGKLGKPSRGEGVTASVRKALGGVG